MSEAPENLKYAKSHEWVRVEDDGSATVGITDHAQTALGDIVFVELPELSTAVTAGQEIAVVESVKAASDIYSPVPGVIVEVNDSLADAPETINEDPYEKGWIYRLQLDADAELDKLLDAQAYQAHSAEE